MAGWMDGLEVGVHSDKKQSTTTGIQITGGTSKDVPAFQQRRIRGWVGSTSGDGHN